jgi:predicted transposase/invertase (TIGR01784 family)
LVKVNRSPRDKEMWRVREKDILDGAHAINKAREEGVEKGVAKGIEQGIEKGIKSTAKKLLLVGISVDQISKATGLSTEEIARLKDDQE